MSPESLFIKWTKCKIAKFLSGKNKQTKKILKYMFDSTLTPRCSTFQEKKNRVIKLENVTDRTQCGILSPTYTNTCEEENITDIEMARIVVSFSNRVHVVHYLHVFYWWFIFIIM